MNPAVAEYLKSAQENIAQSKWQAAKVKFQQAIAIAPHRWDIYFNMGVILAKQQQYKEAVASYQRAIEIKPDYDWSYNNLGEAFLHLGRIEDAIQSLIQAVTINQNNPQFYFNLGKALIQKNSIEQGVVSLRQALALNPEDAALLFQIGTSLRNQGLIAESITCFCRAIELNPNYTLPYTPLKYLKLEPEQKNRLLDFYHQILRDRPQQPDLLANLADLLAEKGDLNQAIAYSRQAIQFKTIQVRPQLADADWKLKQQPPDFIIIGAGKSGTTSLYKYLGTHPQILLPNKKELRFFDRNFNYGYQWYLAQFPALCDRQEWFTGEASPSYFFLPHVAQRISDFAPQTKLIVMLRNPVERTISDYYQNQQSGANYASLEDTISQEIANLNQKSESELAYGGSILSQSLYYYKVKRWMQIFPKNQFLIINSNSFFINPTESMKQVFKFLNLPNIPNRGYQKHNVGAYPPADSEIELQLSRFFAPHNQKLAEYLDMNFDW
ncbi:MAG: tetratricopeptide repeat protein [Cyanobacteria bacterium P01_A01_bin.40]